MMDLSIYDSSKDELKALEAVRGVLRRYKIPLETEAMVVEKGAISHSHPALTLNTRGTDPLVLLDTITHEQLHWFFEKRPESKRQQAFDELKRRYEDLGDCNPSGRYPDSFWEHLVVVWNTVHCLKVQLLDEQIDRVYSGWRPYPKTEPFARDHFDELGTRLAELDMVYDTDKLTPAL